MTNRWQEDIATRLIWLWLNCELNVIAVISYKLTKSIEGFAESIQGNVCILCAI